MFSSGDVIWTIFRNKFKATAMTGEGETVKQSANIGFLLFVLLYIIYLIHIIRHQTYYMYYQIEIISVFNHNFNHNLSKSKSMNYRSDNMLAAGNVWNQVQNLILLGP